MDSNIIETIKSDPNFKLLTFVPSRVIIPAQSPPMPPASPGYKPITFKASLKFKPTAFILWKITCEGLMTGSVRVIIINWITFL